MKILHISTGYPLDFFGGITNYVRTLCKSQSEQGYEVAVLTSPTNRTFDYTTFHYNPKKQRKGELLLRDTDPNSCKISHCISSFRPDLIHVHMAIDFAADGFQEIIKSGISYLVSLHDYYFLCPRIRMHHKKFLCRSLDLEQCGKCVNLLEKRRKTRKLAKHLGKVARYFPSNASTRFNQMKHFLEHAAVLLPVSHRVQEIYQQAVPTATYKTLHIGNSSANQNPFPKVNASKIRVGFLGAMSPSKGSRILEEILNRIHRDDLEFVFWGRGSRKELSRLKLKGLKTMGTYSPDQLPQILSTVHLGLVLSIWEDNGPQTTMEFINSQTPVIGTKRGGIIDFIGTNNGLLFEPDNASEFNKIIHFLKTVTHKELKSMQAKMTRLTSPEEHFKKLENVYRRTFQNRGATP